MQPTTPLQFQAYEAIKERILRGQLIPGTIYSETRLASELGISRTPMRDAIQRLCQEKYLDILPNKGFSLHQMTLEDAEQTIQMRCSVEGYCCWLLAGDPSPAAARVRRQLAALLEKQQKVLDTTGSIPAFLELDTRFHVTLVKFSGNSDFQQLFESYMHRFSQLAAHSLEHPGRMADALAEHRAMVEAIDAGDQAGAYRATLFHMEHPKTISIE